MADAAHARRQAGRSHCWQAIGKNPPALCPASPSQTTLLRNSPGPSPCSCLQAASQLLHPIQRSRSMFIAKRPLFVSSIIIIRVKILTHYSHPCLGRGGKCMLRCVSPIEFLGRITTDYHDICGQIISLPSAAYSAKNVTVKT